MTTSPAEVTYGVYQTTYEDLYGNNQLGWMPAIYHGARCVYTWGHPQKDKQVAAERAEAEYKLRMWLYERKERLEEDGDHDR